LRTLAAGQLEVTNREPVDRDTVGALSIRVLGLFP
jgi:hypothetical protein